jgi:glutamate-1-semialdehyde aminotransferase
MYRGRKTMKWFDKLIWQLSRRAWERNDEFLEEEKVRARATLRQARTNRITSHGVLVATDDVVREHDQLRSTSMNFRLYKCVGGHVLETSVYVPRNDDNQHTLYMIHEDEDFAKQVAQAIMMEQMKQ